MVGLGPNPAAIARLGGQAKAAQARARREERRLTLLDRIARATEQRAQEIVEAYLQAGLGEKGDWRALEALVTRVHGRPIERVDTSETRTVNVRELTPEHRHALMKRVLEDHPGLAALVPPAMRES
jgi:hypothetical protein